MCSDKTVLACHLAALDRTEQRRRADLAEAMPKQAAAVVETPDGYALRLDDAGFLGSAIEWIDLERRCCPFLRFELSFEPASGPIWLRLGGGAGVKEFLAAAMKSLPPLAGEGQDEGPYRARGRATTDRKR